MIRPISTYTLSGEIRDPVNHEEGEPYPVSASVYEGTTSGKSSEILVVPVI